MSEELTKDDLRQFGLLLINDFRKLMDITNQAERATSSRAAQKPYS